MKILNIPKGVYIYAEGIANVNFKDLENFLRRTFGNIKVRVVKPKKKAVSTEGLLFDFINTQKIFATFRYAKLKDSCHIIISDKLFATLDDDNRLHIRAAIFGFPSVISTSGIVEGPAKPKEYYLYKQKYMQLGIWDIEEPKLKKKFKGRFVDYQDKRMTKVLKGYISQALFFYIADEPFCAKKSCRLFNAHWQEELIYVQLKSGEFCGAHKKILEDIKKVKISLDIG